MMMKMSKKKEVNYNNRVFDDEDDFYG